MIDLFKPATGDHRTISPGHLPELLKSCLSTAPCCDYDPEAIPGFLAALAPLPLAERDRIALTEAWARFHALMAAIHDLDGALLTVAQALEQQGFREDDHGNDITPEELMEAWEENLKHRR